MLKYHIQTIEVDSGGAGSITFNNIPQDYDDLEITVSARSDVSGARANLVIQPNSSSLNLVDKRLLGYDNTQVTSATASSVNASINGNTSTINTYSCTSIYMPNYSGSTAKSISADSAPENNSTSSYLVMITAGLWNDSSSITSLKLSPNSGSFMQHSSFSLYGIKRGSDGKTDVAAGGVITQSGGYTIHTFNTSGTFVANRDLEVEYLVVAGGGGGGYYAGAGGGAGGYRSSVAGELSGGGEPAETAPRISAGSYAVTVGAGGACGINTNAIAVRGSNGTNSSFYSVTSFGGGGGGGGGPAGVSGAGNGTSGGSGGGGGGVGAGTHLGGAGTTGQGFAGADYQASPTRGGGGGGAGEPGNTDGIGFGGDGVASVISGASVVRGGGGAEGNGSAGGDGGGGANGNPGAANTGGGGSGDTAGSVIGNGGSGIVIIRYLTPA